MRDVKASRLSSWKFIPYPPILASMLEQRWIVWLLGSLAVVQIVATGLGYGYWQCPIKAATGIPCPACGMSSAITALLNGDWQEAMHLHAFAPILLLAFTFAVMVVFLPNPARQQVIRQVKHFESKTGFVFFLLLAFILYWLIRLY
jgi:hypothetical protein